MPVALHDLGGDGGRFQTEDPHGDSLHLWIDIRIVAHGAGDLAHGHLFHGPSQALQPTLHLEGPESQNHAECDGFGVHSVGAAHHDRIAMLQSPALQDTSQLLGLFLQQGPGRTQL